LVPNNFVSSGITAYHLQLHMINVTDLHNLTYLTSEWWIYYCSKY